jgi:hypothetical protein
MLFTKGIPALLLAATVTAIALPEPQSTTINPGQITEFESQLQAECAQIQSIYDNVLSGFASIESGFQGSASVDLPFSRTCPSHLGRY